MWYWQDLVLPYIDSSFTNNAPGSDASAGKAYYRIGDAGRGFYLKGKTENRTAHPIFDCPSLPNQMKDDQGATIATKGSFQYKITGAISAGNTNAGMKGQSVSAARIEMPSRLIVVIDRDSPTAETPGAPSFNPALAEFWTDHLLAHNGFNALYADGHVKTEPSSVLPTNSASANKLPWANKTQ